MTRYALADPGFWWSTIVGGLPVALFSVWCGRQAVKLLPWK